MTQTDADTADRKRNIENIYPLAPLQEGILFHTLLTADTGIYMPQMAYYLSGEIDADRLCAAWESVLARHSALRSAVHWEERNEPFQIVYRTLPLSWESLDWRGEDAEAELARLFAQNRARPFDLRKPPLFRLHLARIAEDRFILVVCFHHIILDGWSTARLLQDVMATYRGDRLPPARPYADYVRWLKRQDRDAARTFWRDYIADTPGPSLVFGGAGSAPDFVRREWPFPADLDARVAAVCKSEGVTLSTLLQGALGLYVAESLGRTDVFFGSTTAGRPADLPGSTSMVGLFINALPVRARLDPAEPVSAWLKRLQQQQAATIEHEFVALRDIQEGFGTLFDCLLVIENYPVTVGDGPQAISLDRIEFDEWTHFPLTLLVAPGQGEMKLILRHDRSVLSEAELDRFVARYAELLSAIADKPETLIGDLVGPLAQAAPAAPLTAAATDTNPARPPQGATELKVAALWREVLNGYQPQATDNFFLVGGHSLLAAKVVSRLRSDLSTDLPIRTLFDRPVLADFCRHLDALSAVGTGDEDAVVEF